MYLEKAKQQAEEFYHLTSRQVIPCTLEEIEELERWRGHRFPEVYREFLLWMGHSGGDFLAGSDCFYTSLKDLQSAAQELLEEDTFPGRLPDNAFVFFMHQGYQFDFFYLNDEVDPPVHWYLEEIPVRTSFSQLCPHFSDFVLKEMEGHIKIQESLLKRGPSRNPIEFPTAKTTAVAPAPPRQN
jgi:SMI1-KNR4 cell-wall